MGSFCQFIVTSNQWFWCGNETLPLQSLFSCPGYAGSPCRGGGWCRRLGWCVVVFLWCSLQLSSCITEDNMMCTRVCCQIHHRRGSNTSEVVSTLLLILPSFLTRCNSFYVRLCIFQVLNKWIKRCTSGQCWKELELSMSFGNSSSWGAAAVILYLMSLLLW